MLQEDVDGVAPDNTAETHSRHKRGSRGVGRGLFRGLAKGTAVMLVGAAVGAVLGGLSGSSTSRNRLH